MKLTKSRLQQIIKEEIKNINESFFGFGEEEAIEYETEQEYGQAAIDAVYPDGDWEKAREIVARYWKKYPNGNLFDPTSKPKDEINQF